MFANIYSINFHKLDSCSAPKTISITLSNEQASIPISILLDFAESTFFVFISISSNLSLERESISFHHDLVSEIVTMSLRRSHAFGSAKFTETKTNKDFR